MFRPQWRSTVPVYFYETIQHTRIGIAGKYIPNDRLDCPSPSAYTLPHAPRTFPRTGLRRHSTQNFSDSAILAAVG